jgi:hypothetical protein
VLSRAYQACENRFEPVRSGPMPRALIILLLISWLPSARLAWISRDSPQLGNLHDDAIYWVSAKALAQGHGYRILSLSGEPYQTKHPPLYPLWLSLAWRVDPEFPGNLPFAILLSWLMLPLVAILCRNLYGSLRLSRRAALALCAFLSMNPFVVLFGTTLMSDLMFACWILAAVLTADHAGRPDTRPALALCAGLLAGAAYLTRSAAAPFLLSAPACFLLRRQYRKALLFAAGMLPFLAGWNFWVSSRFQPSHDAARLYYTNYFAYHAHCFSVSDLATVVAANLLRLWNSFGALLMFPAPGSLLTAMPAGLLTLAGFAGAIRLCRRAGALQYPLFCAVYLPSLLLWDFPHGERFTLVLLPVFLAGLYDQLARICMKLSGFLRSRDILRPAVAVVGFTCLAVLGALSLVGTASGLWALGAMVKQNRAALRGLPPAYAWIAARTPENAVILSRRDPVLYLHTGRKSIFPVPSPRRFYWENDPLFVDYPSLAEFARAHHAEYLFVSPRDLRSDRLERFADPETLRPPDFQPVYESPGATIYRIDGR